MIWGRTKHEVDAYNTARQEWHKKFIRCPHKMEDTGEWAWLQEVWTKETWVPGGYETPAHWDRKYSKELPLGPEAPTSQPPYRTYHDKPAYCIFCQEKGSTYPVCYPCRKAVVAFRSIAE